MAGRTSRAYLGPRYEGQRVQLARPPGFLISVSGSPQLHETASSGSIFDSILFLTSRSQPVTKLNTSCSLDGSGTHCFSVPLLLPRDCFLPIVANGLVTSFQPSVFLCSSLSTTLPQTHSSHCRSSVFKIASRRHISLSGGGEGRGESQ